MKRNPTSDFFEIFYISIIQTGQNPESRDYRLPTPGQPERLLSISRPQKPQFHRNSITFYRLEFRGRWICLRDSRGGCFVVEMRGGHPGGARETYPDLTLSSEAQKPGFF